MITSTNCRSADASKYNLTTVEWIRGLQQNIRRECVVATTPEVLDRSGYVVSRMYLRGDLECEGDGKRLSLNHGVVTSISLEKDPPFVSA